MLFAAAVVNKPEKDAFTLAREIVTKMAATEPKHQNYIRELRWEVPAPEGVTADDNSFLTAIRLVQVATKAAMNEPRSNRINAKYDLTPYAHLNVRLDISNQKDKMDFPAKAIQAKLDEIKESLSDPKNWKKDGSGNYRHKVTFDEFAPYDLSVQNISYSLFPDSVESVELYRPANSKTAELGELINDPWSKYTPTGISLTQEQLAKASQILGFRNPTVQIGG